MDRTGLSRYEERDNAVRWIAVRHGPDHIHIVAMLARQDRARVSTWNDRYQVRDACLAAEKRYGLRSTAPADRTADRCPTRAEREESARRGQSEPPRITLRRQVAVAAAASANAEGFFGRLGQAYIGVRLRYSTKNPGQVSGYSVSLPGNITKDGNAVWYGGGKLAADLSWPRLCRRWTTPHHPDPQLTVEERQHLWRYTACVSAGAAEQIRYWSAASPDTAADVTHAAGDVLRATAAALGSLLLQQAADDFDRAARDLFGRVPTPTPAGSRLRQAARLISAYGYLTHDRTFAPIVLIIRLAALAEAAAELRQVQQRAAQADAALRTVSQLHAATSAAGPVPRVGPDRRVPGKTRPTADTVAVSFPGSPFGPGSASAPGQAGTDQSAPRPASQPTSPRRRGTTR